MSSGCCCVDQSLLALLLLSLLLFTAHTCSYSVLVVDLVVGHLMLLLKNTPYICSRFSWGLTLEGV